MQPGIAWGWQSTEWWLKCHDEQCVPAENGLMTLSHFTGPDSDEPKLELLINTQKMPCCALFACVRLRTDTHGAQLTEKSYHLNILSKEPQCCLGFDDKVNDSFKVPSRCVIVIVLRFPHIKPARSAVFEHNFWNKNTFYLLSLQSDKEKKSIIEAMIWENCWQQIPLTAATHIPIFTEEDFKMKKPSQLFLYFLFWPHSTYQ